MKLMGRTHPGTQSGSGKCPNAKREACRGLIEKLSRPVLLSSDLPAIVSGDDFRHTKMRGGAPEMTHAQEKNQRQGCVNLVFTRILRCGIISPELPCFRL